MISIGTTQLNNYTKSSLKDVDGLCHETLERKKIEFENNNKPLDRLYFRRMGLLSQDTMMTKQKLIFDKHDVRIIGTTGDTFNGKLIDLELKLLSKIYKNETVINSNEQSDETYAPDETSTDINIKNTKLSLTKYYLTFFFRTQDKNGIPVKFCAARYDLSTIDSEWLVKT